MHQQAHAPGSSVTAKAVRLIFFSISNLCLIMTTQAQNNTFPNSGNAGVGTTNPSNKFEVVGSTRMKGKLVVDSLAKFKLDVHILGDLKIISLEDTALNYHRLLGINQNGKIISYPDLKIKSNSITVKRIYTSRIMALPGDSIVSFGDSTIVTNVNSHSIYNDQQSVIKGIGIGSPPVYLNGNLLGGTIGYAPYSLALGGNAQVTNQGNQAISMGYSMSNSIPYSFMLGFAPPNSSSSIGPTLYVGPKDANNLLGQVGIGTSAVSQGYILGVKGKMIAEDIYCIAYSNWPDFVFEKEYKAITLPELEKYVANNKHLPNIPSAKEIEANNLNIGTMQAKQLQSIEEAYLYIIELNKKLQEQEQRIKLLEENRKK